MIRLARTNPLSLGTSPLCTPGAKGVHLLGFFCTVFFLALIGLPVSGYALEQQQAEQIPHVDQKARDNFLQYIYADGHKAFAIAPGGAWAWSAEEFSSAEAKRSALQSCQSHTQQRCVLYAVNDTVVFDQKVWPQLWRLDKQHVPELTTNGIARGVRFPDLLFKDAEGKQHRLSDFSGSPVLLHFWGSWCPPCMREMPSLVQLQQALLERYGNEIKIILLQLREPFERSLKWVRQHGFDGLPLYDSGMQGEEDNRLHTAGGEVIADRKLARAFPTSYVLNSKGQVLFGHTGPINNWLEYLPFFKDILEAGRG